MKQVSIISVSEIEKDLFLIKKELQTSQVEKGADVSGPIWILIQVSIETGFIEFISDKKKVLVNKNNYWIYIPNYYWISCMYSSDFNGVFRCYISLKEPMQNWPKVPILFETEDQPPLNEYEIDQMLQNKRDLMEVVLNTKPSSLAIRTKNLIDSQFSHDIKMHEIAKKLKTSTSIISREFKKDFGETPSFYKNAIRLTYGICLKAKGGVTLDVLVKSGFNDLSRFHKQFVSYLSTTPSQFSPNTKKSKNAKT